MARELKPRRKCPTIVLIRKKLRDRVTGASLGLVATMRGVRRVVHHSPSGIEWGYGGSGPADLALSIMSHCLPVGVDAIPKVRLYRDWCSDSAWQLHQAFKRSWIAGIPKKGATFDGRLIDAWIDGAVEEMVRRRLSGDDDSLLLEPI